MKYSIIKIISVLFLLGLTTLSFSKDIIELKMSNSNKVVVNVTFKNGSISDPLGKEGLTNATVSMMTQGAVGDKSYSEIQDMLYPWAARYGANVDKEVSTFTFQVPVDFQNDSLAYMKVKK